MTERKATGESGHYFDPRLGCRAFKLLPGEYHVTRDDIVLVTVLGSCVAACIRDCENGIGGMNHFMLPEKAGDAASPLAASARYGAYAMEMMINALLKSGARRDRLEAKVFGGASVLKSLSHSNVGERNARFVLDYLALEQIRVAAQDLLDTAPRKVAFFPRSGRVLVRKLQPQTASAVLRREQEYRRRITDTPVAGDVELFV